MSLLFHQSHSVLLTIALEQIFKLGNVSAPTLFFNIVLTLLGLLPFHMNFGINLLKSTK